MISDNSPNRYIGFDLLISSELNIPGAVNEPQELSKADIEISIGPVEVPSDGSETTIYRLFENNIFGVVPNIANFVCYPDGKLIVDPHPNSEMATVEQLIISSAITAALWLKRELVFHAAAFVMPGKSQAVMVGGGMGIGKSTILEQSLKIGATIIADDAVRVSINDHALSASGLPGGYFRADQIEHRKSDRIFVPTDKSQQLIKARPAALIYLQQSNDPEKCGFQRQDGEYALEPLLKSRHRNEVAGLLGDEKTHFPKMMEINNTLMVYTWTRLNGAPELTIDEIAFLSSVTP